MRVLLKIEQMCVSRICTLIGQSHFFAHCRSPTPQHRRWRLASGRRSFPGHQRARSEQESRSGSGPQRNSFLSSSSTASTTGEDAGQPLDIFMTSGITVLSWFRQNPPGPCWSDRL